MKNKEYDIFVVDTDSYAGNFEREMGAYLTGVVREYFSEYSKDLADLFRKEVGDIELGEILGCHDYDGEHSPSYVSIWDNPPHSRCNSVAIIFENTISEDIVEMLKSRANKYPEWSEYPIKILGFRLIRVRTTVAVHQLEDLI